MNKNYHWITPTVAVGDYTTPNSLFSLIVDLNFPDNQAKEDEVHVLSNVIYVGLRDSLDATLHPLLQRVMNLIRESPHQKILFRCHQGVSRSVTFACCYLSEVMKIKSEEALLLIQTKRRHARPNPKFLLAIKTDFIT
jgi:predicted protein tyrosine phosphatase